MSSKLRCVAILSLAVGLAACSTTGAGASGSVVPTLPIAVALPPASFVIPPASPSAAPSTGPTASPDASSGPPPTPNAIDPCSLLTQEEASTLMGKQLGAGSPSLAGHNRVCTFKSGLTEVKVILAPTAPDVATADAVYDDAVAQAAPLVVKNLSMFDRSGYGDGTSEGAPASGFFVVDGVNGFDVYCGFPACTENASALAATLIAGRLP